MQLALHTRKFLMRYLIELLPYDSHPPSDRDAKQKWANNLASSGWNMGIGGIGGQILTGVVKNSVGRVFGS